MADILVIDDDETVLAWVGVVLEASGHGVVTAANGRTGLDAFRRCPADLVITDLIMPEQEGIETIHDLREDAPNLPIIAMSGGSIHGQGSYLPTATALGATRTLAKPFSAAALIAVVDELLAAGPAGRAHAESPRERGGG